MTTECLTMTARQTPAMVAALVLKAGEMVTATATKAEGTDWQPVLRLFLATPEAEWPAAADTVRATIKAAPKADVAKAARLRFNAYSSTLTNARDYGIKVTDKTGRSELVKAVADAKKADRKAEDASGDTSRERLHKASDLWLAACKDADAADIKAALEALTKAVKAITDPKQGGSK